MKRFCTNLLDLKQSPEELDSLASSLGCEVNACLRAGEHNAVSFIGERMQLVELCKRLHVPAVNMKMTDWPLVVPDYQNPGQYGKKDKATMLIPGNVGKGLIKSTARSGVVNMALVRRKADEAKKYIDHLFTLRASDTLTQDELEAAVDYCLESAQKSIAITNSSFSHGGSMNKIIVRAGSSTMKSLSAANDYLDVDGHINLIKVAALGSKVEKAVAKFAQSSGSDAPKPEIVYCIPRKAKPVKYSAVLERKKDLKYMTARAIKVVSVKRMTEAGNLRNLPILSQYDKNVVGAELAKEVKFAVTAMTKHYNKSLKTKDAVSDIRTKNRTETDAALDAATKELTSVLDSAGVKYELVEARGIVGRTLLLKIGQHVMSVGKSDAAKFKAAKAQAVQSTSANRTGTEPWAKAMNAVAHRVCPDYDARSAASMDGSYIKAKSAKKLMAEFKRLGHSVFEQITGFWLVESKDDETVGMSFDFRKEMTDDAKLCICMFYHDED